MERLDGIVAAAGMGKRLRLGYNKNYAKLDDLPILIHTIKNMAQVPGIGQVIIAVGQGEEKEAQELLKAYQAQYYPRLSWEVVTGGKERQESVALAAAALPKDSCWTAVQDGARPFAAPELFTAVWAAAQETGAAIAAVPCKDTIKVGSGDKLVQKTLDRACLWAVQTPQIFATEKLRQGCTYAVQHQLIVTDDASIAEAMGQRVRIVMGSYGNQKITTPEDLAWARQVLTKKEYSKMEFRVGSGYDVHKLVEGRPLILCGVTIPYTLGLLGHSDADVALHALMDALLGAAGMGDIGKWFPDGDVRFLDADSRDLLRQVLKKLHDQGWQVNNVDVTIIAQRPKLAPYEKDMAAILEQDLGIAPDAINVKATTTEHLGFTGRGEGIAAEAIASLIR